MTPKIRKKPRERFLSLGEFRALLSDAAPGEHLILRIFAVCGLRLAEVLVLRIEDFEGSQLRIADLGHYLSAPTGRRHGVGIP